MLASSRTHHRSVAATLLARRHGWADIETVRPTGFYTLFARENADLSPLSVSRSGLLYLGVAINEFEVRNQFVHPHSGRSTFRRSLGALLKVQLALRAMPYAQTAGEAWGYRFDDESERRLLDWMECHLAFGYSEDGRESKTVTKPLLDALRPPLNLMRWKNPQRDLLRDLRAQCTRQARAEATAPDAVCGSAAGP